MTPAQLARALWETPLPPEEFARRLELALREHEELEQLGELIHWFKRRYPSAGARLAYARRRYAEWTRPFGNKAR